MKNDFFALFTSLIAPSIIFVGLIALDQLATKKLVDDTLHLTKNGWQYRFVFFSLLGVTLLTGIYSYLHRDDSKRDFDSFKNEMELRLLSCDTAKRNVVEAKQAIEIRLAELGFKYDETTKQLKRLSIKHLPYLNIVSEEIRLRRNNDSIYFTINVTNTGEGIADSVFIIGQFFYKRYGVLYGPFNGGRLENGRIGPNAAITLRAYAVKSHFDIERDTQYCLLKGYYWDENKVKKESINIQFRRSQFDRTWGITTDELKKENAILY